MKKLIALFCCLCLVVTCLGGCRRNGAGKNGSIVVYNWGEYLDPEVIRMFEEETGIRVYYEEYVTNESMYPKVKSKAVAYDILFPSDYMVQKLIKEDMLAPINFDNIPNIKNIGEAYFKTAQNFDPENKYSVPYLWGTVGILYNTKMVKEPVDSWSILWDPAYDQEILMQDSVRDAFGITLKSLGYSLNSTDPSELEEAKNKLIEQKPLVQAYVVDQVRDKMIGNEAALGVIYSGEALYCQKENPDLAYVVPKEGSNVWLDNIVIPKNCKNKEGAEKFIDFLCRPEISKMNFDYITYSIPNEAGIKLLDEEIQNNPICFPDEEVLERCETFQYIGPEMDQYYSDLWKEVKSN